MRFLITLFLFVLPVIVMAQDLTVVGRVVDRTGAPVEFAQIYSLHNNQINTVTDSIGLFKLVIPYQNKVSLGIRYQANNITDSVIVYPEGKTTIDVGIVKLDFQQFTAVQVEGHKEDPFEPKKLPNLDIGNLPQTTFERTLIFSTAARSNNELTANYNVQGGSYDENLIYVNGFNIYRPFLTRSGQQEGMSFIFTSLVEDIKFSAGGFNAEYGDKLSSVLDITYKTPDSLNGSLNASMLGIEAHVAHKVSTRFNYLLGARYRSNGYFLNSLPTKGSYNPVFYDAQFLTNFALNENWTWSVIGHYSTNNYRFIPQTQKTDFGTANEAYSFTIYFEGQEQTRFRTMTGGTSLKWKSKDEKTNLSWYATVFNTDEKEYFDVLGQYFINELETDPSKEEYGDSVAVLGIGSFLNHARNRLNATIINVYHRGDHELIKRYNEDQTRSQRHVLKWGVNFQMDDFNDLLSEWKMIDSAGYSVPQEPADEITLFQTIKGELSLKAQRYTSFLQLNSNWNRIKKNVYVTVNKTLRDSLGNKYVRSFSDTIYESPVKWVMSTGVRTGYTTANDEFFVTPRVTLKYFPRAYMVKDGKVLRRDMNYRFSTGLYYQPPFYRQFRTFDGTLNLDVRAQKSLHIVAGTDYYFNMWNREAPFKLTSEAFYKYMWDVNPYEVQSVRTRYFATNDAKAYAYGLDVILNGEFIEGVQSFFKVGLLSTKEDIQGDYYDEYYNTDGEKIIFGYSENQTIKDTVRVYPGYIPRPTDQLLTVSALVQDRMPTFESFSVQMGLYYGSRLPYGPPDYNRYKDTLRMKSYFRVDIGFSYDFLYKKKEKETFFSKHFTDAILSFEVFNLLGINNVLSKQWVQDTQGKYYSIPNYLTQRRFNLKMILRF